MGKVFSQHFFTHFLLLGSGKPNPVIAHVEFSVEAADEDVSQDPDGAHGRGNIQTNETRETSHLTKLTHLKTYQHIKWENIQRKFLAVYSTPLKLETQVQYVCVCFTIIITSLLYPFPLNYVVLTRRM